MWWVRFSAMQRSGDAAKRVPPRRWFIVRPSSTSRSDEPLGAAV